VRSFTTSAGGSVVSWSSLAGESSVSFVVDGGVVDAGVDVDGEGVVGVAGVDLLPQAVVMAAMRHRNRAERSITDSP
jgi:hypothetical protein